MRSTHLLPEQSEGKTKEISQQYLPFTVLKRHSFESVKVSYIELQQDLPFTVLKRHKSHSSVYFRAMELKQHLPFTVCVAGCETAEEQSDDEVRTSQVPEQSEGKTKVI